MDDEDIKEMVEGMKLMLRTITEDDDIFKLGAQMMKKTFDAHLEVGFTEDQAIKVVAGQGGGVKSS
jgi:hypothetical protein